MQYTLSRKEQLVGHPERTTHVKVRGPTTGIQGPTMFNLWMTKMSVFFVFNQDMDPKGIPGFTPSCLHLYYPLLLLTSLSLIEPVPTAH